MSAILDGFFDLPLKVLEEHPSLHLAAALTPNVLGPSKGLAFDGNTTQRGAYRAEATADG
jgi:hypothetical protein